MPNKEKAMSMKMQLASALVKRLRDTALDRITVTEISADCGVNRQTFYYHFNDIYDLLSWYCRTEMEQRTRISDESVTWKESMLIMLDYIEKNKELMASLLNSVGHNGLRRIFIDGIERITLKAAGAYSLEKTDDGFFDFFIKFYAGAAGLTLENYIQGEIKMPPEQLAEYLEKILTVNIKNYPRNA